MRSVPRMRRGPRCSSSAAGRTSSPPTPRSTGDRKSTRLNSSHVAISYAVFCLKKKKRAETPPTETGTETGGGREGRGGQGGGQHTGREYTKHAPQPGGAASVAPGEGRRALTAG